MTKQLTLDIETIPDLAACEVAGVDPAAGFPPWPLHQIFCVSVLETVTRAWEEPTFAIDTYSRSELSEEAILREVERRVEEANVVLTFNGYGFDVPVLLARSAATGTVVPKLAELGQRSFVGRHVDLLDKVCSSRTVPKIRLAHLCAGFGIPVKQEAAGEEVAALVAASELKRIDRYCETDVVATWLADCMWQSATREGAGEDAWSQLAAWIRSEQPRMAHLLPYADVPDLAGGRCLTPERLRPKLVF